MIWLLLLLRIAWIVVRATTPVRIVATIVVAVAIIVVIGTTLALAHRIALTTLIGLLLLLLGVGTATVRSLLRLGTTLAWAGTGTTGLLRLLLLVGLLLLLLLLLAEEDALLGCNGYASLEVTAQV